MIIAQTQEGKVYNIKNWNTFKPDSPILSLTLTDGKRFKKSIAKCAQYYVEWECLSGVNSNFITRESIYGLNDCKEVKVQLLKDYNHFIKHTCTTAPKDKVQEKLATLSERYTSILNKLKRYEVVKYSLVMQEEFELYENVKINKSWLKEGIKQPPLTTDKVFGKRYQNIFKV